MNYTNITSCRLCKSPKVTTVISFGDVALANSYPTKNDSHEDLYPLTVMRCEDCGHIQLKETVSPQKLFSNYLYASSDSPSLVSHFKEYASDIISRVKTNEYCQVLEIGCNDGILLKEFSALGLTNLIGVEPAKNIAEIASKNVKANIINDFFSASLGEEIAFKFGKSDIICANNVFAHVADIDSLTQGISLALADDGIFVFENAYLLDTIKNLYFDQCLPSGQKIISENGIVNIEDIKIFDKVLTHKGQFKNVTKTFKNYYNNELINIFVYGQSNPLRLTPEHPVYVFKNTEYKFIEARYIKEGDILVKSSAFKQEDIKLTLLSCIGNNHVPTEFSFKVDKELCKIFGYYLSEGYYYECKKGSAQVEFSFGKSEKEKQLAKDCANCLEKHNSKASVILTKYGWHVKTYGAIARLLKQECGNGAYNKHVPNWSFKLDNELCYFFIESYINGDGYNYRNNSYWRASTISHDLAQGMAVLANKLGFSCSINIGKILSPRKIANNPKISILKYPPIDILIRKKQIKKIKVWNDKNNQYNQVKKISTEKHEGIVYNIEVDTDNSYVTTQGTVHNCYHEHLQYYGITPLVSYFKRFGLEIFDVGYTDTQGGSFRIFVKKTSNKKLIVTENVMLAIMNEHQFKLYQKETYISFVEKMWSLKSQIYQFISKAKSEGKTICCYGCPAKFALFSRVFGLDATNVKYVVDDSPLKQGRFSPGSTIPIVSNKYFKDNPTDYCIVSVWNMADAVMRKNCDYKGQFIVPLPEFTICKSKE